MKTWIASATLLTAIAIPSLDASAEEPSPLFELARRYETAVEQFERVVLRVRGIDRIDEVWVDRLDDRSAKLRLAAQNPRHLNRLFNEWQEVQKLHIQVEQRIFGKYTPNHDLIYGWDKVNYNYAIFAEEFFYHVENPRHGNSVRKVATSNGWRDRYFKSTSIPNLQSARQSVLAPSSATER